MTNKIYFRVDGSHQTGLGHIVRSMALAAMLKSDFDCCFISAEIPGKMVEELRKSNFGFLPLSTEEAFISKLEPADIVVLDGYGFDENYQRLITATGAKLVCIDDLHDKTFFADLIINHAPGVIASAYKAQLFTQFALGPDYALLRPAFLEEAKKEDRIGNTGIVLICFGGSDSKNLTLDSVEVAVGFPEFKRIIVITGPAYSNGASLVPVIEKDKRIAHYHSIDETQMLFLMKEADLAIVPSSGILLECLAAGCNIISGMYTGNQQFIYSAYKEAGCFIDAGNFDKDRLKNAIKESFREKRQGIKKIDGNSGTRLLNFFRQLAIADEVILREAGYDDVDITFRWAADPAVRKYSFNQTTIKTEEHAAWFNAKLSDSRCVYFIAEKGGVPVGSIRFDIKANEAVISYLVDPGFQGAGLGQLMLIKGVCKIAAINKEKRAGITIVTGHVMKQNIASVKAFERAGYLKESQADQYQFRKNIT